MVRIVVTAMMMAENISIHIALLLAQVYKPFSKSMLNRKMVFRVTKSQSMKDKLSCISTASVDRVPA